MAVARGRIGAFRWVNLRVHGAALCSCGQRICEGSENCESITCNNWVDDVISCSALTPLMSYLSATRIRS
jgi:hypothetical protein